MTRPPISDDVRRFVLTSIPSVPYLEAMLLLQHAPQSPWDAKGIAERLYVSEKKARELLSELQSAGFATADNSNHALYWYHPVSDELALICERLAQTYTTNIVDVTNLIHSNIGRQAQKFADAFKLRKD